MKRIILTTIGLMIVASSMAQAMSSSQLMPHSLLSLEITPYAEREEELLARVINASLSPNSKELLWKMHHQRTEDYNSAKRTIKRLKEEQVLIREDRSVSPAHFIDGEIWNNETALRVALQNAKLYDRQSPIAQLIYQLLREEPQDFSNSAPENIQRPVAQRTQNNNS